MKKSLALFLALLLIGLSFTGILQYSLLKEKDQVTFKDEIKYGNASAAEGITVTTKNHYDRYLFWETTYQTGQEPSVQTDYSFYSTRQTEAHEYQDSFYIDFEVQNYNLDPKGSIDDHIGIDRAFYELYHDDSIFYTEDSGTRSKYKLVHLKDYYDYYPLSFHVTIEDDFLYYNTMEAYIDPHETDLAPLEDFFRIPIIEDDTRAIHIDVWDEDDFSTMVDYSDTYHSYSFNNYGVVTDDSLFYTFTLYDSLGNDDGMSKVDFSHIPGGYGIYRIPYTTEKKGYNTNHIIDADAVSMAYPLDTDISIFLFTASKDNSKLFLAYEDKDSPYGTTELAIIDAHTMETLQTFQLEGIEKADGSTEVLIPYSLYIEEDFVVLNCSSDYLVVLELQDNGLYELKCTVNIHENPVFEYYVDFPWRTAVDWNGEQLAIAGSNNRKNGTNRYSLACGFYLAIFDKDGLVYYSEHDSSLDKGPSANGPYTPVQPVYSYNGNLLLSLNWNE